MNTVFADTFYFIGLVSSADRVHTRCLRFSQHHAGEIVTTAWVITEFADGLSSPSKRSRTVDFIRYFAASPRVHIIPPSKELFDRGFELYAERNDKDWSLTDCISFVTMRDEGLTDALTGDHHFEQAGFVALLK